MEKLQKEYLTVKILLEQDTAYTCGVERALKLLEQQQNEIIHLHKQIMELRSEVMVHESIQREGH